MVKCRVIHLKKINPTSFSANSNLYNGIALLNNLTQKLCCQKHENLFYDEA
jgi:hypothetical protein